MIPAILSCVYVVYLYRKLRDEAIPSGSTPADARSMAERLDALEQRLTRLAPPSGAEEARP